MIHQPATVAKQDRNKKVEVLIASTFYFAF
jgi:hypothetical protein